MLQSISPDVLILLINATVAFVDFNTISLTLLSSRSSILNAFSQVFTIFKQEDNLMFQQLINSLKAETVVTNFVKYQTMSNSRPGIKQIREI